MLTASITQVHVSDSLFYTAPQLTWSSYPPQYCQLMYTLGCQIMQPLTFERVVSKNPRFMKIELL